MTDSVKNNKSMLIIVLATIVFIGLYLLVSYAFYHSKKTKYTDSISLLEDQPVLQLGKRVKKIKDGYEIFLNEEGKATILLKNWPLDAGIFSQLTYTINNLPLNYSVELTWVDVIQEKPFTKTIPQANGHKQNVYLPQAFKRTIGQIGLNFLPQFHLGIKQPNNKPIILNTVVLGNQNFNKNIFTLLHYWFDYKPWNYKSINHLPLNKDLPYYAQPLVFILEWLVICTLIIAFIVKTRLTTTLVFIFTAWLMLDFIFIQNLNKQLTWSNWLSVGNKNKIPDKRLYEIAQEVTRVLNDKLDLNQEKYKIFILSEDYYQKLRLNYHLLPANSGYLNTYESFTKNKIANGDYILSYDFKKEPKRPIENQLKLGKLTVPVKELAHEMDFSLMQVVKP